ncbi:MAG TPA: hypothetical protein VMU16_06255 [Candidatus Binataceae bacterium]|nr:hypothetical protein [Candidatus Binataceae bacterium]
MAKSALNFALGLALLGAAACSTGKPTATPLRPYMGRAATLDFASNMNVISVMSLPKGFAPIADRPPMWVQNGEEIAVAGIQDGHSVVYGLSGAGWKTGRVLAAESGPAAAVPGSLVDAASSPDGFALATAVVSPDGNQLDIVVRDLIANGAGHSVAVFDGSFDSISIAWLNSATIAVALRRHPDSTPNANGAGPDGLQLVVLSGAGSAAPITLTCPMSRLSWSPHGIYAVGEGDAGAPPILIDRRTSACKPFHTNRPIRVLDWDLADEGTFLYAGTDVANRVVSVYKYNIATGTENLMGLSSAAAAFTSGGQVLILGNQKLNFRVATERPTQPLTAQIALARSDQSEIDIKSLAFQTTPAMLDQSSIAYSKQADEAAIQTFSPSVPIPWRKIINYSMTSGTAYMVGTGPASGTVTMAWSPKGRWLAVLDGDAASGTAMAILAPPR